MNVKKDTYFYSVTFTALGLLCLGCAADGDGAENASTQEFRSALVAESDIELKSSLDASGTSQQALNGDPSEVAAITRETVRGTNKFIVAHFDLMKKIVDTPPTRAEDDRHIWEGTFKNIFLRITMEKSDAERGTRFDYTFKGRTTDQDDNKLQPLISGHVIRLNKEDKQGFGILRFHFTNLNDLFPDEHDARGIARIAFRGVGKVRQVRVRMIGMETPKDPDFPKHAAYGYTLLPNDSGAMRWFAKSDVMKDGAPLENVSVHSIWRGNKSGLGFASIAGGSLTVDEKPVDFLHLTECWDTTLNNTFVRHAVPNFSRDFGEASSCFKQPESTLSAPDAETLPDEDPEIPTAHADEAE